MLLIVFRPLRSAGTADSVESTIMERSVCSTACGMTMLGRVTIQATRKSRTAIRESTSNGGLDKNVLHTAPGLIIRNIVSSKSHMVGERTNAFSTFTTSHKQLLDQSF